MRTDHEHLLELTTLLFSFFISLFLTFSQQNDFYAPESLQLLKVLEIVKTILAVITRRPLPQMLGS